MIKTITKESCCYFCALQWNLKVLFLFFIKLILTENKPIFLRETPRAPLCFSLPWVCVWGVMCLQSPLEAAPSGLLLSLLPRPSSCPAPAQHCGHMVKLTDILGQREYCRATRSEKTSSCKSHNSRITDKCTRRQGINLN